MTQEPSRGARTRHEILRSACSLFLENGFHGTSMREIARRAGIAVGGIYNHYASKEDIFMAVLIDHHPVQGVLPLLQPAQGETIEEFVRDIASRLVQGMGESKELIHLLFIELVEFKGTHIPQIYETFYPHVMDFTQQLIAGREELRPIPASLLIRSFIGLYFSYVMTELIIRKQQSSELQPGVLENFVDIFLHGILKGT